MSIGLYHGLKRSEGSMIKPTNGRVVLYTPSESDEAAGMTHYGAPLDAHVVHVWNDRMVNLAVFDANGKHWARTSVPLLQDDDAPNPLGYYCQWMAYQKGQAAKTEAIEKQLAPQVAPKFMSGAVPLNDGSVLLMDVGGDLYQFHPGDGTLTRATVKEPAQPES